MKKLLSVLLLCLWASWVQAYEVDQYVSDLYVQANGQVKVVERVTLQGLQDAEDITRNIPLRFRSQYNNNWRAISVSDVLVRDKNKKALEVSHSGDGKNYSIAFTVDPEQSVFEMVYTLDGLVDSLDGYDQIQYRTLVNQWPQGVNQFAASVHMPQDIPITQVRCIVGDPVDKMLCNVPSRLDHATLAYAAHLESNYREDVSIQIQFGDGVGGKIIAAKLTWWEWVLIVLGIVLILLGLYVLYRYVKHKKQKHD